MYNPSRPNAQRLAVLSRELCEIVHKTDATHPVTLAAAFPELSAKLGFIDPLDVVGFNYKEHLYEEHSRTSRFLAVRMDIVCLPGKQLLITPTYPVSSCGQALIIWEKPMAGLSTVQAQVL